MDPWKDILDVPSRPDYFIMTHTLSSTLSLRYLACGQTSKFDLALLLMLYTEMIADHRNKCGDLDNPNNNVKILNDCSDLTLLYTEESFLLDI